VARYPVYDAAEEDREAEAEMATLKEIVTSARATRADANVDPKQVVEGILYARNRSFHVAQANETAISRLARVKLDLRNEAPPGVDAEFVLQLQLKVDREKVAREIGELEKVIANSQRQLTNEAFIAKAPEKIVAGMRQKQAEYEAQLAKLRASL
jgi:valyl-tRNA synthetase